MISFSTIDYPKVKIRIEDLPDAEAWCLERIDKDRHNWDNYRSYNIPNGWFVFRNDEDATVFKLIFGK